MGCQMYVRTTQLIGNLGVSCLSITAAPLGQYEAFLKLVMKVGSILSHKLKHMLDESKNTSANSFSSEHLKDGSHVPLL